MLSFRLQAPKIVTESGHTQGYHTQTHQQMHTQYIISQVDTEDTFWIVLCDIAKLNENKAVLIDLF